MHITKEYLLALGLNRNDLHSPFLPLNLVLECRVE